MSLFPENTTDPGQKNPFHTTAYVREQMRAGGNKSGAWNTVGFTFPDGTIVPQEYLITVTSIRNHCSIVAPMQEPIRMEVESRWDPFIPSSILNEGNVIAQAVTQGKKSLITRASSRRIWQGSSPIRLNLKLKFQAINDAVREVVEPVRLLQAIALPWSPKGDKGGSGEKLMDVISHGEKGELIAAANSFVEFVDSFPLLSPPGPSPFTIEGILDLGTNNRRAKENQIREDSSGGDIIVIEVGRFLTFYNVIVSKVSSEVPIMMTVDGDPVSASVDITFETYEMITTDELARMYSKNFLSGA